MTNSRRPGRLLSAALATSVLLTACTGSDDESDADGARGAGETDSAGEVQLPADAPLEAVGDAGTQAVQGGGFPDGGGPVAQLTDVRAAGAATFDRFVLEFDGTEMPSYRVGYVEPPIRDDGSGATVDVEGSAFLQVQVTPASGTDLSGEAPEPTYDGPDRIEPADAGAVTEAVGTGDFEALLTWTVGLGQRVPFGVTTLQDPLRLVVDIRHEATPENPEPVGEGATVEARGESSGSPVIVTDVRLGVHDGFDRIVFETASGGRAGWQVGYTVDPRSAGSGEPVPVPGGATLGIALTNVAPPPDAPEGVLPWDGPQEQSIAGAATLQGLVEDSLFEGRYGFFAGLDERRPFAVRRLESPERIVVDVFAREPDTAVVLGSSCTSPSGYAVEYPEDWAVNEGDVVAECSRFAPAAFDVPEASDGRFAAVVLSVEPVPFDRVTEPRANEEARTMLTVDGREAVRIERKTRAGLYPIGTRITSYAVDLGESETGRRTLVADTIGLAPFDYERNVDVLDAMMRGLDLDATD